MKLQRENLEKWPTPMQIVWTGPERVGYIPGQGYRFLPLFGPSRRQGIPVQIIASASQAYALQRAMLKRYDRFMDYHWSKRNKHASSATLLFYTRNFASHLQHIQPGALYFYSQVVVGTRKISRPFPDPKNPNLTTEQIASTPGIEGSVVIDDRFARYYVKATVSRLNVIPKDRYQRAE